MAFCKKCGVYLADGTKVCPSCGAAVPGAGAAGSTAGGAAAAQAEAPREETRSGSQARGQQDQEPWEKETGREKEPWEKENRRRERTQRTQRQNARGGAWNPGQSQNQGWTGPGAWRYTGREDARRNTGGYTPPYMGPQDLDAQANRNIAALSYFGVLFFLPLVLRPKSPFCRFHANQGLLLLLVWIVSQACFSVGFFGWIAGLVLGAGGIVGFFKGISAALRGQMKELPIVGGFRLIK